MSGENKRTEEQLAENATAMSPPLHRFLVAVLAGL
jgi:hypothetical protein